MAKKATPDLQASELSQIKSFYEQERMQLAARLHHIDQVIDRLSGGREPIAGPAAKLSAFPGVSAAKAKRVVEESVPVPVKRGPGRPRKNPLVEESKTKKAGGCLDFGAGDESSMLSNSSCEKRRDISSSASQGST